VKNVENLFVAMFTGGKFRQRKVPQKSERVSEVLSMKRKVLLSTNLK
jgi:hypothetical protein